VCYGITVVAWTGWSNQTYVNGSYKFWWNYSISGECWLSQITT